MLGVDKNVGAIQRWQRKLDETPWLLALHAAFAAFWMYFCTYSFRRPFSASGYEDVALGWSIGSTALTAKTVFVIAQLMGYSMSKFVGLKWCSELPRAKLMKTAVLLVSISGLALLGFATLPLPLKVVSIFLNGLPLGLIWGLIVRQLEGRKLSELLLAALSCSYILSSGEVKRAGQWLMSHGVDEFWMPFVTGAAFFPLFLFSAWLLSLLHPPNAEDISARSIRTPLDQDGRRAFLRTFLPGMILLCLVYMFLTAYRDFRDNYQVELFHEMGIFDPVAFSRTERPVAFGVIAVLAMMTLVRNNRIGLTLVYILMASGLTLLGGSTWLYSQGKLGGEAWMIASGLGTYLAYVPFGSMLFERTIAVTRFPGTAVFAIYVADSLGYFGSVAVQLYRNLFARGETWLQFFKGFSYAMTIVGVPLLLAAMAYFLTRKPVMPPNP